MKVVVDEQVVRRKGFYDNFLKIELLEKWVITGGNEKWDGWEAIIYSQIIIVQTL
jgi:hypothetical protein